MELKIHEVYCKVGEDVQDACHKAVSELNANGFMVKKTSFVSAKEGDEEGSTRAEMHYFEDPNFVKPKQEEAKKDKKKKGE